MGPIDRVKPSEAIWTTHIAHVKSMSTWTEEDNEDGLAKSRRRMHDGIGGTWQRPDTRLHQDDEDGVSQVKEKGEGVGPCRRTDTH